MSGVIVRLIGGPLCGTHIDGVDEAREQLHLGGVLLDVAALRPDSGISGMARYAPDADYPDEYWFRGMAADSTPHPHPRADRHDDT